MSSFEIFMSALLVGVLGFQAWLTRRVFQSSAFDAQQKRWQTRLIWLVPLLGAVMVYSVLRDEDEAQARRAERSAAAAFKGKSGPRG